MSHFYFIRIDLIPDSALCFMRLIIEPFLFYLRSLNPELRPLFNVQLTILITLLSALFSIYSRLDVYSLL